MTVENKQELKRKIINSLKFEEEIERIVLFGSFGSFVSSDDPHDIDIAIFQNSEESYLRLAMKYRRLTRDISKEIPVDIIPLRLESLPSAFLTEIEGGEVVYER